MTTAILPKGTQKGTIVGINGAPHYVCKSDVATCVDQQFRAPAYYIDGADLSTITEDICEATAVELPVGTTCCCGETMSVLVPEALAASAPGTAIYTEEYANDGTPLPDLADAGAILVGFVANVEACEGLSYWDKVAPEAPEGYAYLDINPVSANEALIAAL